MFDSVLIKHLQRQTKIKENCVDASQFQLDTQLNSLIANVSILHVMANVYVERISEEYFYKKISKKTSTTECNIKHFQLRLYNKLYLILQFYSFIYFPKEISKSFQNRLFEEHLVGYWCNCAKHKFCLETIVSQGQI